HDVLLHEIPAKKAFLDSALEQTLSIVTDGDAKSRGLKLGKAAAQAIIIARSGDGSAGDPISPVPVSGIPGIYQAVPPFDFAFAPYWENLKLFGLQSKDQFRCAPRPVLNSEAYTVAYN